MSDSRGNHLRRYPTDRDRITKNIVMDARTGCWNWRLRPATTGYGVLRVRGHQHLAHRFSYELHTGPIPQGLELDHLCRNRTCVNPDHLEPVTSRENSRRSPLNFVGINAAKTRCPQGHEYDRRTPAGQRYCRRCRRATERRYRIRKALRAAAVSAVAL